LYAVGLVAWAVALLLVALGARGGGARLVGLLLGVLVAAQFAGHLLPSAALVRGDLSRAAAGLGRLLAGEEAEPGLPFLPSAEHIYSQGVGLLTRLNLWAYNLRIGSPRTDEAALLFSCALAVWVLAFNATHQLVGRQRAFAGLLPVATAVGAHVYLSRLSDGYVYAYLGVLVAALVWANIRHMEGLWMARGLAPQRAFRPVMVATGLLLGAIALGTALVTPNATYARTFHTFWRTHGAEIEAFYRRLDDAFAGRGPLMRRAEAQAPVVEVAVIETLVTSAPSIGELPPHTVGSGFAPGDEPVMWVALEGARSGASEKQYWRERTYDAYTDQGWENGSTAATQHVAGSAWVAPDAEPAPIGEHVVLRQRYTLIQPSPYAFGVNEPVALDLAYSALTRGPGDLAALSAPAAQYVVDSHVPSAGIAELRAAEGEYPGWVRERYLPLPPIPERVRAEALRIVSESGATTRYDKARAVEAYLRALTYDTEAPAPPPGVDVVDHFLFETRAGFCDHSASAMTVLLRSLGVATRYASGYAMGTYDADARAWLVRASNAHAWVEVYFPGVGWIEFEPTPAQGTFQRPETRPAPDASLAPLPTPPPMDDPGATLEARPDGASRSVVANLRALAPWLVPLCGGALLWIVVRRPRWLPGNSPTPREVVAHVYLRLAWLGALLGSRPSGATPREVLTRLDRELRRRLGRDAGVGEFTALYERARYGAAPVTWSDASRATGVWRRVRAAIAHGAWRLVGRARD